MSFNIRNKKIVITEKCNPSICEDDCVYQCVVNQYHQAPVVIHRAGDRAEVNHDKCTHCMGCVNSCPIGALIAVPIEVQE